MGAGVRAYHARQSEKSFIEQKRAIERQQQARSSACLNANKPISGPSATSVMKNRNKQERLRKERKRKAESV